MHYNRLVAGLLRGENLLRPSPFLQNVLVDEAAAAHALQLEGLRGAGADGVPGPPGDRPEALGHRLADLLVIEQRQEAPVEDGVKEEHEDLVVHTQPVEPEEGMLEDALVAADLCVFGVG